MDSGEWRGEDGQLQVGMGTHSCPRKDRYTIHKHRIVSHTPSAAAAADPEARH
jgi:hypothetical protein